MTTFRQRCLACGTYSDCYKPDRCPKTYCLRCGIPHPGQPCKREDGR